jgi:hypothetical protein
MASNGLIAVMGTTMIAASAATWFLVNSQNENPTASGEAAMSPASNSSASNESSGPTICVGVEDNVLRVPPGFGSECPEGQQELDLEDEDQGLCELCDPFEEPQDNPQSDDAAVNALEQRIRKLENTAYFEVVSQKDEKTIFRVGPGGARFFNSAEAAVAAVGTSDAGGYFTGRSSVGDVEASIGASGNSAGVPIFGTGIVRVELGTREGPYALRFPSEKGLIAGLGQSRAGSGAVLLGTLTGVTQGSITVTEARAMLSLTKDAGPGGVAFTEATIGGGLLDIALARGDAAVRMGHNGHRYGIVLAGPVLGIPYVPRTGVPGSYFVGCASGQKPACIPEVAGR